MADRPVNPYAGKKLQGEGWERGFEARRGGKPRIPPARPDARSYREAWIAGWDAARPPEVTVPILPGDTPIVPVQVVEFLPETAELPDVYIRPRPVPCGLCRAVRMPDKGQAVVVKCIANGNAYFECRSCRGSFKLRVE